MNAQMITYGPWQIPVAVKHCLCPDGTRRRVRITGQADTFFSIPASVTVKRDGKATTISGYVTGREGENGAKDYEFVPTAYGKNYHFFGPREAPIGWGIVND